MPLVSLSEWNQFFKKNPQGHFLQTGEWGDLKAAFGWEPYRIISNAAGVQLLLRKLPLGYTLAYIPKSNPDECKTLLEEVDSLCRAKNSILLKFEPDGWSASVGGISPDSVSPIKDFRISPHAIQPPRTIVVDIQGSEEDILSRMKQKCRYNIRLAEKKGVVVRKWEDVDAFHRLMEVTGSRDGFGVHSLEYYRRVFELFHPIGMVELLVAEFEGSPLAALMIIVLGKRAWYLYGASTDEERNRMPAYLLQWEAIKWAKSKGAEEYDLWGVPDESMDVLESQFEGRSDGLWGVYRFKRGFGGVLHRAVPAVDKVYQPLLYRLYLWRMSGREMG